MNFAQPRKNTLHGGDKCEKKFWSEEECVCDLKRHLLQYDAEWLFTRSAINGVCLFFLLEIHQQPK